MAVFFSDQNACGIDSHGMLGLSMCKQTLSSYHPCTVFLGGKSQNGSLETVISSGSSCLLQPPVNLPRTLYS